MNKLLVALCVLVLAAAIIGCASQSAPTGTPAPPTAAPTTPPPTVAPATGNSGSLTADDIDTGEVSDPTAGTTGSTPDITP